MAGGRAVVFSEDERADSSAGVGGRGRLSAVELRLPELSWRGRAAAAGAGGRSGGGGARSQECVAVSPAGTSWALLNCSPEIRQQIEAFPGLHPRGPRHSPIAAILFTNGDLDHTLGLLSLRESHPLIVYATEPVRRGFIEGNVLYKTLERFPGQATWRPLKAGREEAIVDADGK